MSFWYNGIKSDDMHVIVEEYPKRVVAKRKMEKESVAGSSRDILYTQDAFENVTQPYKVYISAKHRLPEITARAVAWLMSARDYVRLEDNYFPDVYRKAFFSGPLDIENHFNNFGKCKIEFDCDPRRFWKSGEKRIVMTNGGALYNPSPYVANPLLIISGAGAGSVTVGAREIEIKETFDGVMYVDCDDANAFSDAAETQSANEHIHVASDAFPQLPEGKSIISWTGGVTGVAVVPNWWTI